MNREKWKGLDSGLMISVILESMYRFKYSSIDNCSIGCFSDTDISKQEDPVVIVKVLGNRKQVNMI